VETEGVEVEVEALSTTGTLATTEGQLVWML
jgi:hypothetical protein